MQCTLNYLLKLETELIAIKRHSGLAYGNRSAVLHHLNRPNEAVADVQLALKHKFPKNSEYKLHQRQGMCLMKLGRTREALRSLEKALETLPSAGAPGSKMPKKKRACLTRDIEAMIKELKSSAEGKESDGDSNGDELIPADENPVLAGAAAGLAVSTTGDPVRGRRVIAERAFKRGELLFSEEPFASVLLPENYSTHCHHCHKAFFVPIPCLKCTQSRYCSGECGARSWDSYHKFECSNLDLLHSVGVAHLALRLLLQCGNGRLRKAGGAFSGLKGGLDGYDAVLGLVEHAGSLPPEDLFQYAVTATLLTMMLEQRTDFFAGEDAVNQEHVTRFSGAVVLKHILQLICNASAIYEVGANNNEHNEGNVYSQSQYRIATAIYASASMMNHSCVPSVINDFRDGRRIVVRAVKDICGGAEVFNCYGPHASRQRKKERKECLLAQYNFDCECEACSSDVEHLDKFSAFLCGHCNGPIPRDRGQQRSTCSDCGRRQSVIEHVEGAFASHELFADGMEKLGRMDYSGAIAEFEACLKVRRNWMFECDESLVQVLDKLAECSALVEDYRSSAEYLGQTLKPVELRFGPDSVEVAHELVKLSDVLQAAEGLVQAEELKRHLKRAADIFRLHYGESNVHYKEVKGQLDRATK